VAEKEFHIQGSAHSTERDGRTTVGSVPTFHDHFQPDHTKPEYAKGLPSKPEPWPEGVFCPGEQELHVLPERRVGSAAVGDQNDALAKPLPEPDAVRSGDVRRFVERPEPETETVYAVANYR